MKPRFTLKKLTLLVIGAGLLSACSQAPEESTVSSPAPSIQFLEDPTRLDIYHSVELTADLSSFDDNQKRMLALLSQSAALMSPDSGPAHMATCTGTPVIGLHAASNPWRSGPYQSRQWCVDAYNEACQTFLSASSDEVPWGTKVEKTGVMDLISVAAVIERIDALASDQGWLRHNERLID